MLDPSRIVSLEATMRPSAKFAQKVGVERPGPDGQPEKTLIGGSAMLIKILFMPRAERLAILADGAEDPILILLAMLTAEERRQLVSAAETFLKELVTRG